MDPTLVIGGSVLGGVLAFAALLFALRQFVRGLREKGRSTLAARYPAADVVRSETMALSFGLQSKGPMQMRGNGVLALTRSELYFAMYVGGFSLAVPLQSIVAVTLVRSHLGKTQGARLLHVRFTVDGVEDAIAWRVPSPELWVESLETLRK
jgi:hypothetical protein